MKNNKKPHKLINEKTLIWGFLAILLVGAFAFCGIPGRKASAQESDNSWTTPVNLSQSGAASNPVMVVDSNNIVHVIWEDQFDGWVYTSFDGDQWSSPVAVAFPFANATPRLFSDPQGFIHAVWMNDDNTLHYSRVVAENFGQAGSWEATQTLASSAVDFDLSEDGKGNLYLAYVRILDGGGFPAGIYYRNSRNSGTDWSQATSLYTSAYFRSLQKDSANVRITNSGSGDTANVFIAWDNRLRKQVFLAQSHDGGNSWDAPQEIDRPDSNSGTGSPFNIRVSAEGDNVLLIWQNGSPGTICTQFYTFSGDAGANWSQRERMLDELSGCADENTFIDIEKDYSVLQTIVQNQIYFLAWDGTKWSEPKIQRELGGFVDPQTLDPVVFGCYQLGIVNSDRLFVVGCDTGGGGDIWETSRNLGSMTDWFPKPSVWSIPKEIASTQNEINSPILISGLGERMHILWSQKDETIPSGNPPVKVLYYSSWDGSQWSSPRPVLQSPKGDINQYSAAVDNLGRLLVVWNDSNSEEIYFSWANESKAGSSLEWAEPSALPVSNPTIGSQDIAIDGVGTIYVVYVIPLNEERGVYITHSLDVGVTWSQPVRIFDAAANQWQMVDQPHLTITESGDLHVLWARLSLPGGVGSQGLYYSRSEDGGMTWSDVNEVTEAPIDWSQVVAVNGGSGLQRLWQESVSGQSFLKYQSSMDRGVTWSSPETFPSFSQSMGPGQVSLTSDMTGTPHIIREILDSLLHRVITHWMWDGSHWVVDENKIELQQDKITHIDNISSAISAAGQLGVTFSSPIISEQTNLPQDTILFTSRSIDLLTTFTPPSTSTISTPAPQGTPVETTVSLPEMIDTPTPTMISLNASQSSSPPTSSNETGLLLGAGLAGLIVMVIFGWKVYLMRGGMR